MTPGEEREKANGKQLDATDAAALVLAAEVSALNLRVTDRIASVEEIATARIRAVDERLTGVIQLNEKSVQVALQAAEKAVTAALVAADRAVAKAEAAAEKRFESVNEFRGQLADQAGTFMPRVEYSAVHKALEERLESLGTLIAANIATVHKALEERLESTRIINAADVKRLEDKYAMLLGAQAQGAGKSMGIEKSWAVVVAVIMAVIFAASLFVSIYFGTRHPSSLSAPAAITAQVPAQFLSQA
jgi:hypothetical protein